MHVTIPCFSHDGRDVHLFFCNENLTGPEVLQEYHESIMIPWMLKMRRTYADNETAVMWYSHDGDSATRDWVVKNLPKMTDLNIRVCL